MADTRSLSKVERLAVELAICAPMRQARYSVSATVPWSVVHELRAELQRAGVDWRDLKNKMEEIRAERRALTSR